MAKPTKFLTDIEIEERAATVLDRFAPGGSSRTELPVDIDTLTECDYRFKVVWKPIDDPQGCRTYGAMTPLAGDSSYTAELILNENFRDFLSAHPEIERLTRGHELCHWEVHVDEGGLGRVLCLSIMRSRPFGFTGQTTQRTRRALSKCAA